MGQKNTIFPIRNNFADGIKLSLAMEHHWMKKCKIKKVNPTVCSSVMDQAVSTRDVVTCIPMT